MVLQGAKENTIGTTGEPSWAMGMGRAGTCSSACLDLWHVVGVYSCEKGSDEVAP